MRLHPLASAKSLIQSGLQEAVSGYPQSLGTARAWIGQAELSSGLFDPASVSALPWVPHRFGHQSLQPVWELTRTLQIPVVNTGSAPLLPMSGSWAGHLAPPFASKFSGTEWLFPPVVSGCWRRGEGGMEKQWQKPYREARWVVEEPSPLLSVGKSNHDSLPAQICSAHCPGNLPRTARERAELSKRVMEYLLHW